MIYERQPPGFQSAFAVVSCFLEYQRKILLLLRADDKPQPRTWGVPAGKVHDHESLLEAIAREVREETSIILPHSSFSYVRQVFVRYRAYSFSYHMFKAHVFSRKVTLNQESSDFKWVTPTESLELPLIQDEDACIKLVYHL